MRRDEIEYIRVLKAIEAAVAAEELVGKAYVTAHTTHACLRILHLRSFNIIKSRFVQGERERVKEISICMAYWAN